MLPQATLNARLRSDPMSVDDVNTDRSWRSSDGSSTYILTGGSDRGQILTGGSDKGPILTGGSDRAQSMAGPLQRGAVLTVGSDRGLQGGSSPPNRSLSGSVPPAGRRTASTEL